MATEAGADKTLLVVEDDPVAREGLATLLRREGYTVVAAAHGRDALQHLRHGPAPDLILLDMLMPVLDGWHFLEQLRHEPAPAVPIIVTTVSVLSREWALDHGCAGFVRKPIDLDDLLHEVRRCLPGLAPRPES